MTYDHTGTRVALTGLQTMAAAWSTRTAFIANIYSVLLLQLLLPKLLPLLLN